MVMVANNSEGVDARKHKRAQGLKRDREKEGELKVMVVVMVLAGSLAG